MCGHGAIRYHAGCPVHGARELPPHQPPFVILGLSTLLAGVGELRRSEAKMLLELRAENYAVIDRTAIQLGSGLNLLTGETGAGKSILIDALALLLGGKVSGDVVRHGSDKAVISCTFEMTSGARSVLETAGVDADEDEVVLRREVSAAGKGRVFINNQPATVATLKLLAPELALVHSQGETMGAFDQTQQRLLLDRFGNISTDQVAAAFESWRLTVERLRELESSEDERLRMADLWRFQSSEITAAGLVSGDEDTELEAEKRILANAEKLFTAASTAHDLLYEAEQSAEASLGAALKQLEELARFNPRFQEPAQQLATAKALVEDVDAEVRDFADTIQASPGRLEEIEDRLAALDRLKRKYGPGLADVLAFGADAAQKLSEVENRDALLESLRSQQIVEAKAFEVAAARVNVARKAAAILLAKHAEAQINDLAMRARFSIRVLEQLQPERWSAHGYDQIEFLIATNPGEPLKPLNEIASGGEMSRVLLALKVTVEEGAPTSGTGRGGRGRSVLPRTLVFDEIDIGIGGRAAEAVGRKLKALAAAQQVICITHLPQIAAFADQHFLIAKSEKLGRTETTVHRMERGERIEEIARMLSGARLTDTSLKHAEHLLETSA